MPSRFEFAFDATAIMTSQDGVAPIIEIVAAGRRNDGKGMVLAINQYPLHMLRPKLRSVLPAVFDAIEWQWRARLHVEPSVRCLIRLGRPSARRPVAAQSPLAALRQAGAEQDAGEPGRQAIRGEPRRSELLARNFRCLSHAEVQARLFRLFARVVSSGGRATIRELWILCAQIALRHLTGRRLPRLSTRPGIPSASSNPTRAFR